MAGVIWGGLVPHPPLIIPEIGQNDLNMVTETSKHMAAVAREIKKIQPDTVVIISPHGPVFYDGIPVWDVPELHGSFSQFGYPHVQFAVKIDQVLVSEIRKECEKSAVPLISLDLPTIQRVGVRKELDHGVMVPLHFLQNEDLQIPTVIFSIGLVAKEHLFQLGKAIQAASEKAGKRVAVLASGDLSHCLSQDAPAGYNPAGKKFDESLRSIFESGDLAEVLHIDSQMITEAAECGYNPIVILMGALDGKKVETEVMSYEGPFGVGYMVVRFLINGDIADKTQTVFMETQQNGDTMSVFARWAKTCLESYVRDRKKPVLPNPVPSEMNTQAATFVSIKKNGLLRGCIGTIIPARDTIAEEICENAISAGIKDPRFYPVTESELPYLSYSVDILSAPEMVSDHAKLDPEKYGVIVRQDKRIGLLLPDLEGIESVSEQLTIACQKAGIDPDSEYDIERFQVIRYE